VNDFSKNYRPYRDRAFRRMARQIFRGTEEDTPFRQLERERKGQVNYIRCSFRDNWNRTSVEMQVGIVPGTCEDEREALLGIVHDEQLLRADERESHNATGRMPLGDEDDDEEQLYAHDE